MNEPARVTPKLPVLSAIQSRVLGSLIEKEKTVPDTYPMTLNGLVGACNQKTSRAPIMTLTEAQVQEALDDLKRLSLVLETSGGRVMRYSHNAKRVLAVPSESVALIATLLLRGPQTAAELRINSERLCKFSDISAVEGFLDELAQRSDGPYVVLLPRQAGMRESRWMHLLGGPPSAIELSETLTSMDAKTHRVSDRELSGESVADLNARIDDLQAQVSALQASVADLCKQLGVAPI